MKKKPVLIVTGAVVVAALIALNIRHSRGRKTTVYTETVGRRDLTRLITASGNIKPKRKVDVSATAMGKVTRLDVAEGDRVKKGDALLEIDPLPYETVVDQLEAAVRGAAATLELEQASLRKAQVDYDKANELGEQGFSSGDELRTAKANLEIAQARVKAARESLTQTRANLTKAKHDLNQVRITAEMSGIITALNVEEGESAIMGTINNPGTVLLTIADLSEMEAEVKVDETEVVSIKVGQSAKVRLDAYPDTSFAGVVSEVGNSAIRTSRGLGQESVDFKVVVSITDVIPNIRPGLSASVDVMVARENQALAVPIQCLTIRDAGRLRRDGKTAEADTVGKGEKRDLEGVFVVADGEAHFREIEVGISGESYFQVVSGLTGGEEVVTGPFAAINDLRDGDRVKVEKKKEE